MATIKHDLINPAANKAYVELSSDELEVLAKALEHLTNRNHYCVKCCSECGHTIRKKKAHDPTRPQLTVTSTAKELGVSRQNLYQLLKQSKIELMRFLQLQKILKCQILTEQDINIYSNYLKSLLLKGEGV